MHAWLDGVDPRMAIGDRNEWYGVVGVVSFLYFWTSLKVRVSISLSSPSSPVVHPVRPIRAILPAARCRVGFALKRKGNALSSRELEGRR